MGFEDPVPKRKKRSARVVGEAKLRLIWGVKISHVCINYVPQKFLGILQSYRRVGHFHFFSLGEKQRPPRAARSRL